MAYITAIAVVMLGAAGFLGMARAMKSYSDLLIEVSSCITTLVESVGSALGSLAYPPASSSPPEFPLQRPLDPLAPANLGLFDVDPTDGQYPTQHNGSNVVPAGMTLEQFLGIGDTDAGPIVPNPTDFPGIDLGGEGA